MTRSDRRTEEFVALVTQYQTRVYLFILSLLPTHADADEVLQETNLLLWRRFNEFQPGSDFRAWAFQVAFRKVQEFIARRGRDRLRFNQEFMDLVAADAMQTPDDMDARHAALIHCLSLLSDKDRELIQSRYQVEATTATVAQQAGRSIDAIYKAVARIRRTLHTCIERKVAQENHR
jgi:RNA polymerase sigma-70 factor (ECF subfamily)